MATKKKFPSAGVRDHVYWSRSARAIADKLVAGAYANRSQVVNVAVELLARFEKARKAGGRLVIQDKAGAEVEVDIIIG
jgi:Arc/MetJ-type ribon-helix-helix transcriptional regulator